MRLLQVQHKLAGGLSAQRRLSGPQRHGDSTLSTQGKERVENHTAVLKCCCPEGTWMTFAQISLDKATDMGTSKIKGPETLNPLLGIEGEENRKY